MPTNNNESAIRRALCAILDLADISPERRAAVLRAFDGDVEPRGIDETEWISVTEAAKRSGKERTQIDRWIKSGRLAFRYVADHRVVDAASLAALSTTKKKRSHAPVPERLEHLADIVPKTGEDAP